MQPPFHLRAALPSADRETQMTSFAADSSASWLTAWVQSCAVSALLWTELFQGGVQGKEDERVMAYNKNSFHQHPTPSASPRPRRRGSPASDGEDYHHYSKRSANPPTGLVAARFVWLGEVGIFQAATPQTCPASLSPVAVPCGPRCGPRANNPCLLDPTSAELEWLEV